MQLHSNAKHTNDLEHLPAQVLNPLGKGSFGQVVRSFDFKTSNCVALKMVFWHMKRRVFRTVAAVALPPYLMHK